MEQLHEVRSGAKQAYAFNKKEHEKDTIQENQPTNNRLMALFKQIKEGDEKAMETLSVKYIQLIIDIAADYKCNGLTDLELILKGNCGLIKAAEKFDDSRGIDFSAYATWSVRQAIIHAIDEKELLKPLPLNKIGLLNHKKYWPQNHQERAGQLLQDLSNYPD